MIGLLWDCKRKENGGDSMMGLLWDCGKMGNDRKMHYGTMERIKIDRKC